MMNTGTEMMMNDTGYEHGGQPMKCKCKFPAAQEYLGRIRKAERHVKWLKERKDNLQMLLTDTSVHYSMDMPHSESPDLQMHETLHAEIDALEREIREAEVAAAETKLEVGRTVCKLSEPVVQRVLLLRYLEKKSWQVIAGLIKYSPAQTYRLRDKGYKELEEMIVDGA